MSKVSLVFDELLFPIFFENGVLLRLKELTELKSFELQIFSLSATELCRLDWNSPPSLMTLGTYSKGNESCRCNLTLCVRDLLLTSIDSDDFLILVSGGETTDCIANYSDLIFASGKAIASYTKQNLPFHSFLNWRECERLLIGKLTSRYSARRQARLQRMDAFKTE